MDLCPLVSAEDLTCKVPTVATDANVIQAIDKAAVHQICSGQVVLTLAVAVKELLENSLDAGANSVEVRLKEYGSLSVEVIDNGEGVENANFQGLTLKHHTSKLRDFSDLVGVSTFGFRGEALSSLCALCDVIIVTRHISQNVGSKLVYNNIGILTDQSSVSRQVGTTVSLQNLFYTLPVRHKEFIRNLKREFGKMVHLLNSYCLVSTGVRISCTNMTNNKKKTTIVSTGGHLTIQENISAVYGSKQVASLIEFKQVKASGEILQEFGLNEGAQENELFRIHGFVSSCTHGLGRSSTDRQFYFINSRPCDADKISRVINEVYHTFNRHQYPFVILNVQLNHEDVDVNVTPDKRQIFFSHQKLLLATLKTSLLDLYGSTCSTLELNSVFNRVSNADCELSAGHESLIGSHSSDNNDPEDYRPNLEKRKSTLSQRFSFMKGNSVSPDYVARGKRILSGNTSTANKQRKLDYFLTSSQPSDVSRNLSGTSSYDSTCTVVELHTCNLSSDLNFDDENNDSYEDLTTKNERKSSNEDFLGGAMVLSAVDSILSESSGDNLTRARTSSKDSSGVKYAIEDSSELDTEVQCHNISNIPPKISNRGSCSDAHLATDLFLNSFLSKSLRNDVSLESECLLIGSQNSVENSIELDQGTCIAEITTIVDQQLTKRTKKVMMVNLTMESMKRKLFVAAEGKKMLPDVVRKFRAPIAPGQDKIAEAELTKEICKEMFAKMSIIGQFNLGFIVTRLNSDLFIIDQHATDEKFNFETLQCTVELKPQRLVHPQPLQLTPANELVLLDNLQIFTANGFEFLMDEEQPPGQRARLIAKPHSRSWDFGPSDVDELLFMLSDSPGVRCRPSRVRDMLASRACRQSVMIGTALGLAQMRRLVDHMGEMDQPWNCPHGRPTMRHLINLDMLTCLPNTGKQ